MSAEIGPYSDRERRERATCEMMKNLLEDIAPNAGLYQGQAWDVRVLCTTNFVGEDLARALNRPGEIPLLKTAPPLTMTMRLGGTWQFATWLRGDMRNDINTQAAREFLGIKS